MKNVLQFPKVKRTGPAMRHAGKVVQFPMTLTQRLKNEINPFAIATRKTG